MRCGVWGMGDVGEGAVRSLPQHSIQLNSYELTLQMLFSDMRMFLAAKSLCTNPLSAR